MLITATSASFTNTTIACLTVGNLPTNWMDTDIGQPAAQGSADYYLNVFAVKGGGAQIFGSSDQFNFAYQPWTNGLMLTARVSTQPATSPSAESGVMIRETTNASSKYVDVVVTPSSINMEARTTTGGSAVQLATFTAANSPAGTNSPSWVRLQFSGNTFAGYASSNGVAWVLMGVTNVNMANTLAGLAVCAYDNTQLNTSMFDNVNSLSTNNAPVIASQPTNQSVAVGSNVALAATAGGVMPLSYQWWFNTNTIITWATNASLAITNVQSTNAGSYTVVVTNSFGSVTSSVAMLATFVPSFPLVVTNYSSPGTWLWTCPANVISVQVECWGGGGAGGSGWKQIGNAWGGGGAGGAYARAAHVSVAAGTNYLIIVGNGGISVTNANATIPGGYSAFSCGTTTNCLAGGGAGGVNIVNPVSGGVGGNGGTGTLNGCIGDVSSIYAGGNGANGATSYGGGGGGGAGDSGPGGSAGLTYTNAPGSGGTGTITIGGAGGGGAPGNGNGTNGVAPGGGGGGARSSSASNPVNFGGSGGAGQVILTYYTAPTVTSSAATGIGPTTATLNGSAADNGNAISERGFFYRTSSGVTTNDTKIAAGSGAGAFAAALTLSPNTHYCWKAYAINLGGLVLSSELDFYTLATVVPVFTNVSMSADRSAFTLAGTGAANQTYLLQKASSLAPPVTWTTVSTNITGTNGFYNFTDGSITNSARQFYRLATP